MEQESYSCPDSDVRIIAEKFVEEIETLKEEMIQKAQEYFKDVDSEHFCQFDTYQKLNLDEDNLSVSNKMNAKCVSCGKKETQENLFFPIACRCKDRNYIHINCLSDYKKQKGKTCPDCRIFYKELPNEEESKKIENLFLEKIIQKEKDEEEFNSQKNIFWSSIEQIYPNYSFFRKYYEECEKSYEKYASIKEQIEQLKSRNQLLEKTVSYYVVKSRDELHRDLMK